MAGTWHKVRPTRYELRDENGCVASIQYFPRRGVWRVDTFDGIAPQTIGRADTYQAGREMYEAYTADHGEGVTLGDDNVAITRVRYADDEDWTHVAVDYDDGVLRVFVNGEAWVPNGPGDDIDTRVLALELSVERIDKRVAELIRDVESLRAHSNGDHVAVNENVYDARVAGNTNARVKLGEVAGYRQSFAPRVLDDWRLSVNSKIAYLSDVTVARLEAQMRVRERQDAAAIAAIRDIDNVIAELSERLIVLEKRQGGMRRDDSEIEAAL